METKKITNKSEMAEKIRVGVNEIASITARTLGPGGLPILIERRGTTPSGDPLSPQITKDGVTVASECASGDPEVDLVIQTVKAICRKTNRIAGDGTTTAIVLGQSILLEALAALEKDPKLNPQLVRDAIEAVSREVQEQLKTLAIPVKEPQMIEDVATISANGDREIGKIIRQAFEAVGAEGVITVDEGHGTHTTIDVVEGFQIRRGAEAQDRFFNNTEGTRFEVEDARVILFDGKLTSYTDLLPPLNAIAQENPKSVPPIVIVANDFAPEVIHFLLIQRAENNLKFCAVKSPDTTTIRTQMLDDMSIMLDSYRFGNGNRNLASATGADIGGCERVVVDKYTATFYNGEGEEKDVIARVDQLKSQRATAESPYDAARISDRIAALSQGIAKIGVGGSTDLEIKERYHRIEDALNAARAAVEEGVIPGAGIILARMALDLQAFGDASGDVGEQIMGKALLAPFVQILENIGLDPMEKKRNWLQKFFAPDRIEKRIMKLRPNETYDARKRATVDALSAGIIDPVKVTRTALENATSIAALLSTCGGGIVWPRPKT